MKGKADKSFGIFKTDGCGDPENGISKAQEKSWETDRLFLLHTGMKGRERSEVTLWGDAVCLESMETCSFGVEVVDPSEKMQHANKTERNGKTVHDDILERMLWMVFLVFLFLSLGLLCFYVGCLFENTVILSDQMFLYPKHMGVFRIV